jgi:hypothetical protein
MHKNFLYCLRKKTEKGAGILNHYAAGYRITHIRSFFHPALLAPLVTAEVLVPAAFTYPHI